MKNSLKTMFLVVLGMVLMLFPTKSAFAMEEVFANEPDTYPAKVTVFMYSSKESSPNIHVVTFYNDDTGETYIFKMNKYNYGYEDVWRDQIFLPEGKYFVSGNIYQDTWATFTMYTPTEEITISADKNTPLYCMMGTPDFIAQNKFTMDDIISDNPIDGKKDTEPEYMSNSIWWKLKTPENCHFTYQMIFDDPDNFDFTPSFLEKYKGQYEEIADWIVESRARIDYNTGTDRNEDYYNITKDEILKFIDDILRTDEYTFFMVYGKRLNDVPTPTVAPKATPGASTDTNVTPAVTQPAQNPDTIQPAATPTPVPEQTEDTKSFPLPVAIIGGVIAVLALLLFVVNAISKRRR